MQQPAKQEAAPKTSEQKDFKEDDELEKTIAKFLERMRKTNDGIKAKKKNCSDGPSNDDSS